MSMSMSLAKVKYRQFCVVYVLLDHCVLAIDRFGESISMIRTNHVRGKIALYRLLDHARLPFPVHVRVTIQAPAARWSVHVFAASVQLLVQKLVTVKQQRLERHEQSRGRFAFFALSIITYYTTYFVVLVIRAIALQRVEIRRVEEVSAKLTVVHVDART